MAGHPEEAAQLLPDVQEDHERKSEDSVSTASTTSLVLERIGERVDAENEKKVLNGNSRKKMVDAEISPESRAFGIRGDEHAQQLLEDEEKDDSMSKMDRI